MPVCSSVGVYVCDFDLYCMYGGLSSESTYSCPQVGKSMYACAFECMCVYKGVRDFVLMLLFAPLLQHLLVLFFPLLLAKTLNLPFFLAELSQRPFR